MPFRAMISSGGHIEIDLQENAVLSIDTARPGLLVRNGLVRDDPTHARVRHK
jgi:hypothetical protein